jgi:ArsR family transcriptional regulator
LRAASGFDDQAVLTGSFVALLEQAEAHDEDFGAQCAEDRRKLTAIRSARQKTAEDYFTRHASDWDELRSLHSPDQQVEETLIQLLGHGGLGRVLDIGTGTGRIAEIFAQSSDHVVALDKSLEMLKVARAKLQDFPAQHVELVQGDFLDLPFSARSFDTIVFHQVLHFAQEPEQALAEAARVAESGAQIAIIDFAAHGREELREKHAHARLGFTDEQIAELLTTSGFEIAKHKALDGGELTVKIWIGQRRADANASQTKEKTA